MGRGDQAVGWVPAYHASVPGLHSAAPDTRRILPFGGRLRHQSHSRSAARARHTQAAR